MEFKKNFYLIYWYSNQLIEWLGDVIIGSFKKEKTQVDNPACRHLVCNYPSISLVYQQSQCVWICTFQPFTNNCNNVSAFCGPRSGLDFETRVNNINRDLHKNWILWEIFLLFQICLRLRLLFKLLLRRAESSICSVFNIVFKVICYCYRK